MPAKKEDSSDQLVQLEKLFMLSTDFICVVNVNGVIVRENPAFSKLIGWMESSDTQKHFDHFIHPSDLPAALEAKRKSVQGASQLFTSLCQTQNHEELIIEWVATIEDNTHDMFAIGRDITLERKRELLLAESENKFRSFFENSQGLMCIHDTDGSFTAVNTAGAGLLGYTVAEILQMSLYDLVSAEFHKALGLYLKKIIRHKKAQGILNFKHKDGTSKVWMFNNIYEETLDGKGKIIGNAIDITERHQLERDLKHTQKMLEETNKIAKIGGWDLDPIAKTLNWSSITKEIHEVPADYTPTLESGINFYKEGESRNRIAQLVEQGMKDGKGWDEELQLITAKGKEIWVRAIGTYEFVNGTCTRLFGTFQNIDDKKRAAVEIYNSRKQLHDLLQSASEVSIISTDPNGLIRLFNRGAEKMLGYTAEEMNKQSPALIHDPLEIQIRSAELTAEYNTPIEGFRVFVHKSEIYGSEQHEWTYIKKDGSRISVSLVVSCIRENDGEITGYLGVATDITASKKAQAELSYEKSRLQSFVEHAPAAVAMFDRDLRYIAVSNRWLEENKMTGTNLIGKLHYEVMLGC